MSRSYWVGLPVGITVHDDGTIEVEIDMSEASSEMQEAAEMQEDGYSEEQILLDMAIVDAERTVSRSTAVQVRMSSDGLLTAECPVKYACKFSTRDLNALGEHIENFDHSEV